MNVQDYVLRSRVGSRVQFRWPFGPMVAGINRVIVEALRRFEPEVVWLDKPTMVTPETMDAIRAAGAKSVFYVQDAPFGPRKDGCWGQFFADFPEGRCEPVRGVVAAVD